MKPKKNKVYCKDCGRFKMIFETEKKANNFIKFNSKEIDDESGISPNRSYYCLYCGCWHVTSSKVKLNIKSKTELVLEQYEQKKEKLKQNKQILKKKQAIIKAKFNENLNEIEEQIKTIDNEIMSGKFDDCIILLNKAFSQFKIVIEKYPEFNKQRIKRLRKSLNYRSEILKKKSN